ncbi:MAG: hypothetical protein HYY11_03020 [Candidatus Methylomirabilis oxyfera]|nr:hypothetical protein [Candidatus Methylomirabilis oxyfera]
MGDMTISEIERLTKAYAEARAVLSERVGRLEAALQHSKRQALPGVKAALAKAAEADSRLRAAIESAPALFERPRTLILHGIKVGIVKAKGKLVWDDPDQVVALIRKHCPDQADVLIVVRETPSKPALAQLTAAELKRVGVRVIETGDEVLVQPTDSEVDKLVGALLREALDAAPEAA